MKITKKQLKQIIKEEIESTLKEYIGRPLHRPYSDAEQKERDKQGALRQAAVEELNNNEEAGALWDKLRDHTYGSEEEYNTDLNAFAALFPKNLQAMAKKLVAMNQH
tara:strand:+ start:768 stop:1088 length:321 start_codon:yes stop_codon:yes gene_type:complete